MPKDLREEIINEITIFSQTQPVYTIKKLADKILALIQEPSEHAECCVGGHNPPCIKCSKCGTWIELYKIDRIASLQAQNERYRRELQRIIDLSIGIKIVPKDENLTLLREIAQEALKEDGKG